MPDNNPQNEEDIYTRMKMPEKVSKVSWVFWAALAVLAIGLGVWMFG